MNPSLHINAAASKKMDEKNDTGKDGVTSNSKPTKLIADLKANMSFKSECLSENSGSPEDAKSSTASPDRCTKAASNSNARNNRQSSDSDHDADEDDDPMIHLMAVKPPKQIYEDLFSQFPPNPLLPKSFNAGGDSPRSGGVMKFLKLTKFRGIDHGRSKFRAEAAKIEKINFPD